MKVIGLTGNSGSGKGIVAQIMKEYGAVIIDCDKTAHKNMLKSGAAYNELISAFGEKILKCDGEIDRKILGSIVFNDSNKLKLLNEITHKYIVKEAENEINKNSGKKVVVIDAPLLIESGLNKICDSIWVVYAPFEMRIERVMKRDGIDREGAVLRFKNQTPFEDLKRYADIIIENDEDIEKIKNEITCIMKDKGLI